MCWWGDQTWAKQESMSSEIAILSCSSSRVCGRWTIPENDPIQKALYGLMERRVRQQEIVQEEDIRVEFAKRNDLLLEAEKARKEAALAIKRNQVRKSR